jgi:hypothetical protein
MWFSEKLHRISIGTRAIVEDHDGNLVICVSCRALATGASPTAVGGVLLLFDTGTEPTWLWTSSPFRFVIDADGPYAMTQTVEMALPLEAGLIPQAGLAVVKMFDAATDAWSQIKEWLVLAQRPRTGYHVVRSNSRAIRPALASQLARSSYDDDFRVSKDSEGVAMTTQAHTLTERPTLVELPNLWTFSGRGVDVTYSTTSVTGKPLLTYHDTNGPRQFEGDEEIARLDTALGTEVTVELATTTDRGSTAFTLILPYVNLAAGPQPAIHTIGVTSIRRTSIVGPAIGQATTYHVQKLHGTAAQVQF